MRKPANGEWFGLCLCFRFSFSFGLGGWGSLGLVMGTVALVTKAASSIVCKELAYFFGSTVTFAFTFAFAFTFSTTSCGGGRLGMRVLAVFALFATSLGIISASKLFTFSVGFSFTSTLVLALTLIAFLGEGRRRRSIAA